MQDKDIVGLCSLIYDPASIKTWDHFFDGSVGGIYAGIKDNALIFRGSITAGDWLRDLEDFPSESKAHPQLGSVHAGFYEGMDEFFQTASKLLGQNPYIGGHSLGAARAWLFGGLLTATNNNPRRITVFGSPKPGGIQLANLLAPVSKSSYRNGVDPVCDVPFWIGEEVSIEPIAFQSVKIEPIDWSEGLMAWHNILLYEQGVPNVKP